MAMSVPLAFHLKNVTHTYEGGKVALNGVTADIPAGQSVAVLGPSGCGKTTLLTILGLLWDGKGPSGTAEFHDGQTTHDLLKVPGRDKSALRADSFGFILQSNYMLPHFNCRDNVGMPLAFHGWPAKARAAWAEALLNRANANFSSDLRPVLGNAPRHVSVGQRQRFGVLRALAADPAVVFADEPSSNLDPGGATATFDLLELWQKGKFLDGLRTEFPDSKFPAIRAWLDRRPPRSARTLVLVCHDVHAVRDRAERFLLLNNDHRVERDFLRANWKDNAADVARILRLPSEMARRISE